MGTAGGVKTTTLAVLVMSIIANLRGKKDVEVLLWGLPAE